MPFTLAVSCVGPTQVVARLPLLKTTTGFFAQSKQAPFAVSMNCVLVATAVGAIESRYGVPLHALITTGRCIEVPPPGDGLATVTCAVAGLPRSPAGRSAASVVDERKRVVRPPPFQFT